MVLPIPFLTNMFTALKGSQFYFLIIIREKMTKGLKHKQTHFRRTHITTCKEAILGAYGKPRKQLFPKRVAAQVNGH